MKKIGIIGFGRFGKLLHQQLRKTCELRIFDPEQERKLKDSGIPFSSLEEVCSCELIILAVPVKYLKKIVKQMIDFVRPPSMVMDVCAVKTYPIEIIKQYLAQEVQVLGSHPLFGPDSVTDTMQGHTMIICPARINTASLQIVKDFWENFEIQLIEMTPDEQDRLMAWTLALTHFLGRSLVELPLPDTAIATRDYQNLIQLMKKINRDTWDLFEDMHRFNPYTREMREALSNSLNRLKLQLDNS